MDLKFAMLADYVTETREAKLVIGGIFEVIRSASFPVVHTQMYLAARWESSLAEGTRHRIAITIVGPNGEPIIPRIESPLDFVPRGPGKTLRAQLIANVGPIQFPAPGAYRFELSIIGKRTDIVPFDVVQTVLE